LKEYPQAIPLLRDVHLERIPAIDRTFRPRDLWDQRANGFRARSIIRRYARPDDEIMIFNSTRPESQWLKGKAGKCYDLHYVEDGLDAYIAVNSFPVTVRRRAAHRVAYGRRHPLITDMLLHLPFSTYHVLFPELFRLGGHEQEVIAIDGDVLRRQVRDLGALIGLSEIFQGELFTHFRALRHTERVDDIDSYINEVCIWAKEIAEAGVVRQSKLTLESMIRSCCPS